MISRANSRAPHESAPPWPLQSAHAAARSHAVAGASRGGWLLGTFPGRSLLIGVVVKAFTWTIEAVGGTLPPVLEAVDMVGSLALIFVCAYGLTRLVFWAKRRLLWRVRRKLILSYVFVGVVPVLLVITFFLLAGLLLFFNVSSYLVKSRIRSLTDQAQFLAQTTARSCSGARRPARRSRRSSGGRRAASPVSVPVADHRAGERADVRGAARARRSRAAEPPGEPAGVGRAVVAPRRAGGPAGKWITCDGFAGLLAYSVPPTAGDPQAHTRLVTRAVAVPELPSPTWAVVLDLPLSQAVEQRITEETGIRLGEVTAIPFGTRAGMLPVAGRSVEPVPADPLGRDQTLSLTTQRWVAFLDYVDWSTGTASGATLAMRINAWAIYERLSAASASVGEMNFGQVLLAFLALVGILFLIIQFVALVIGLLLARQITGAVHDLFTGTQHLRNRDFAYTIPVRARDQLGELAESFNAMTGEVTTLLGEVAEKGRMEQEMHAAREIQQKLLPPAPKDIPGLTLAPSANRRARWPATTTTSCRSPTPCSACSSPTSSGKGLAAGLYMAQLKVIVQSLARLHHEPREFLIAVNKVVAQNLDQRSFITMTYGVIDLERREMTFARAGHCPLIHVPGGMPPGLRKPTSSSPTAWCWAADRRRRRCSSHAAGDARSRSTTTTSSCCSPTASARR
jgi:phosphoserine phosphatase RsbU/P